MGEELKKLFRGKWVIRLLMVWFLVNAGLLFMQRDKASVMRVLNEFCKENGSVVTEENQKKLEEIWKEKGITEIPWEKFEENLQNASTYAKTVNSREMAETYSGSHYLSGTAAEYVYQEFQRLEPQIKEAAEEKITFFLPYRQHIFDFLSGYFLFALNLEGIASAVLISLYLIDMQRSSRTAMTVYSTQRGRKILWDKLGAAVVGSLLCFGILVLFSILLASIFFPFEIFWKTSLYNPLVSLKGLPCIPNTAMTIGTYVMKSFGMSTVLVVIYSLGSFATGLRLKNSYYGLGAMLVILSMMKLLSKAAPTSTKMFFWLQYNPLDMALKSGTWFLYNGHNFSPFGYEIITAVLWFGISLLGCLSRLCCLRKEKKYADTRMEEAI